MPLEVHRYFQSKDSISRNYDLSKNMKMISNIFFVIQDLTKFIELWEHGMHNEKYELLSYLNYRRNNLIRYFLLLILKKNIGYSSIKNYTVKLESLGVYPISDTSEYQNRKLRSKFLDILIGKKIGLCFLSVLYAIHGNLMSQSGNGRKSLIFSRRL